MRVTIFGSGYVGLVTGACLADAGNNVLCVDVNQARIDRLQQGELPIYEPGLEQLVGKANEAGRLHFTSDAAEGVRHGLFQFIAVGTPADEDGSADLSHVRNVARTIAENLDEYRIVVNKSTVPVGTGEVVRNEIQAVLEQRGVAAEFDVVSNPEFLKEGTAVDDFMKPDRIIVGTENPRTAELLRTLYEPFNRSRDRMLIMGVRSAELTKYAANSMLATKISFMNELANVAERCGADIEQVRIGIGSDPRIGYEFIYPGCGFGGSCFPKDVRALISSAAAVDFELKLLSAVQGVNDRQKRVLFEKIRAFFGEQLTGKVIALWGLSFKPNTDDMREASSRSLMEALWESGVTVRAYDPVAKQEAERIYGQRDDLVLCDRPGQALEGADALAVVTEWREFRSPDFEQIRSKLNEPVIFDGRNLYDPKQLELLGFRYFAIGRGEVISG
jgi:UDPglucose 6-dehydrogenase